MFLSFKLALLLFVEHAHVVGAGRDRCDPELLARPWYRSRGGFSLRRAQAPEVLNVYSCSGD